MKPGKECRGTTEGPATSAAAPLSRIRSSLLLKTASYVTREIRPRDNVEPYFCSIAVPGMSKQRSVWPTLRPSQASFLECLPSARAPE